MKDCNDNIKAYHEARVKLAPKQRKQLRDRRNANRDRLKNGLERDNQPLPDEFIIQGSYAAKTTIQEPKNAYDIDDGAAFWSGDLKGSHGGHKSPLDAKKMVRDAVDDGSFTTEPEVKTNCVRVHYNDGSHVDIPVYRKTTDAAGITSYEIASADWKESNPKGVNSWFGECLARRSESGGEQMRESIRLLKSYCKNRPGYSLPSGFVLTVLVDEAYGDHDERMDRSFRNVMIRVLSRLRTSLKVAHPVVAGENLAESYDPKCGKLRDLLENSLECLTVLDRPNCTRSDALRAWKKVFHTDYFDKAIEKADEDEKRLSIAAVASISVMPKPYATGR